MSDEFGTVNLKERAREVEIVRKRYRRHREALVEMAADAPTEHLASEYRRLIQEVDVALAKVDELEGPIASPVTPGSRPLVTPPPGASYDDASPAQSRIIMIVIAGLVVLAIIGWLIWRASSDERPVTPVTEEIVETTDTTAEDEPEVPAPAPVVTALQVEPQVHDYGVIRKGTRAARQFEIVNTTGSPLSIDVARSTCRCLYYDYADAIPAKGRETLTVTVDGAKAETGPLRETIRITSERDPSVETSFDVTATIQ
jgi:hypothetical protein